MNARWLLLAATLYGPALAAAADSWPSPSTSVMPSVSVEGRAMDASNNPVASARIGIFRNLKPNNGPCPYSVKPNACLEYLLSTGVDRAHTVADKDGRFTLQLPGGLTSADVLWAEGEIANAERVRAFWSIPSYGPSPTMLGDIPLQRANDFIVVVRSDGKLVSGAQVSFLGVFPQRTDETGSVWWPWNSTQSPGVGLGMSFFVRTDGFATFEWDGGIASGATTQTVDLVRESVLTGRVTDAGGRPLPQAVLTAIPAIDPMGLGTGPSRTAGTARTDATGTFALHGLRAGRRYRLSIAADEPSIANGERTITAGEGPIDIVMNAAVPVTLAVSGLENVRPNQVIPSAEMARWLESWLGPRTGPYSMRSNDSPTDPVIVMEWLDRDTGAWLRVQSPHHVSLRDATHADLRVDRVPVGTVRVRMQGGMDIAEDVFEPVVIQAGSPVVIPVPLEKVNQLRLQVIDEQGNPVSGAKVEITNHIHSGWDLQVRTEADGSVTVPAHPAHDVRVKVTLADRIASITTIHGDATRPAPIVVSVPAK